MLVKEFFTRHMRVYHYWTLPMMQISDNKIITQVISISPSEFMLEGCPKPGYSHHQEQKTIWKFSCFAYGGNTVNGLKSKQFSQASIMLLYDHCVSGSICSSSIPSSYFPVLVMMTAAFSCSQESYFSSPLWVVIMSLKRRGRTVLFPRLHHN